MKEDLESGDVTLRHVRREDEGTWMRNQNQVGGKQRCLSSTS